MNRWWSVPTVRRLSGTKHSSALAFTVVSLTAGVLASPVIVQADTVGTPAVAGSHGAALQQPGAGLMLPKDAVQTNADRELRLARPVTLSLENVTLEAALLAIQERSGVVIAYGDRVVPLQRRVSLDVSRMPVMTAVQTLLKGTNVGVKLAAGGKLVLYQLPPAPQDSVFAIVNGQVSDAATKKKIPFARVSVEGTNLVVLTNADGTYSIPGIPAGKHVIAVRLLGYSLAVQTITVTKRETLRIDFLISPVPQRLQEVVTTGAGDRQRVEVGNSISSINADSIVRTTPIKDVSDLIKSRAVGTQVLSSGGTVGSGSRIRIRGISGVLSNSDPILIVDGVRMDAGYSQRPGESANTNFSAATNQVNTYVPATSRLNDIDPESIESIEILKGPSAATLYGSDAANGVIVIKTKRGRPGPTRWGLSTTQGVSTMKASFMDAWMGWGSSPQWSGPSNCTLSDEAADVCTQDSVTHYNPLNFKNTSPFGTGYNASYNAQVSGGTPQIQYFLSGTHSNERGLLKMPTLEAARLIELRGGAPLPEWAKRPNILTGTNVNVNLNSQVNPGLDIGLTGSFLSQYHRDAAQGPNGIINQSYTSMGYRDSVGQGWGLQSPGASFLKRSSDATKRVSGGAQANYRPHPYVTINGLIGMDYTARHDESLLRANDLVPSLVSSERGRNDSELQGRNANLTGTLNLPLNTQFRTRTSLGAQYNRSDYNSLSIFATGLPAGSDVPNNATGLLNAPQETRNASATAGWFIDQSVALREGVFVTAALRGDAGSAFGRQARPMLYPKFNGSWLISQEDFFPKSTPLTNLRLRAAFGQAGVQPSVDARFRSFRSWQSFPNGTPVSGIQVFTLGNSNLVPERSVEFEGGLDLGAWNDRVTIDATTYYKYTKNALITRTLPPSYGILTREENIGEVENRGLEISASLRPLQLATTDWTITLGYSRNSNTLVKLGTDTVSNSYASSGARYVAGYPVNGFWGRPIVGYMDRNGDGVLTNDEIQLADSAVYVGQPTPKGEFSLHSTLALLSGRLSIAAGFNYQGGLTQLNQTLVDQCSSGRCQRAIDRTVSFTDQAIGASFRGTASNYFAAYEQVSWLRWNDLSVTLMGTPSVARALRASAVSVSLMGRNLAIWSNYRGPDPEVNTLNAGNHIRDLGSVPQPRDWSIRVNLNY